MQPGASSLEEFAYDLPPDLIAQAPLAERTGSRLLRVHPDGRPEDLRIPNVVDLLQEGDLLVVNDTRVIPARLFGRKATGGKIEMLLERLIDERTARVQLRSSRSPGIGTDLTFDDGATATVAGRDGTFFILEFAAPLEPVLERHGHMPLPPYIERPDDASDRERYQTVFSRESGAVAAPTAALHFDEALLGGLRNRGVGIETVTLHVGAGTFAPLRQEQLEAGQLHAERVEVPEAVCVAAERARAGGHRVIALGTTTTRALESAALQTGSLAPFSGETTLFIRPGFDFRVVDALLTNFHLPESSLLMLVCAFGGTQSILAAYAHAVRHRYRFFSYGDAMFCYRQT